MFYYLNRSISLFQYNVSKTSKPEYCMAVENKYHWHRFVPFEVIIQCLKIKINLLHILSLCFQSLGQNQFVFQQFFFKFKNTMPPRMQVRFCQSTSDCRFPDPILPKSFRSRSTMLKYVPEQMGPSRQQQHQQQQQNQREFTFYFYLKS